MCIPIILSYAPSPHEGFAIFNITIIYVKARVNDIDDTPWYGMTRYARRILYTYYILPIILVIEKVKKKKTIIMISEISHLDPFAGSDAANALSSLVTIV